MSVRLKLALTIFATGIVTMALVITTVIYAFQRFERETAYRRGSAFLQRVTDTYDGLFELHARRPEEFQRWLDNLVLFEPGTQLYLLDTDGTVMACSGTQIAAGFKVSLKPVLEASGSSNAAYVMGDDPKRMSADAVIAVQPVRRQVIRPGEPVGGYLYLVLHTEELPEDRWAALRTSIARPALGLIVAVVGFTTLVAVLIIVSVTRPLQRLTVAVATISQRGLGDGVVGAKELLPRRTGDEFGQLTAAFAMLLDICQCQWDELRRLDHFRREGVSNLSHDLRSPLTATAACLEMLDGRWAGNADPARAEDRRLIEVALRNTRNAARLVRSLGDLAQLDEPEFALHTEVVDLGELLDDIAMRFADRARHLGIALDADHFVDPLVDPSGDRSPRKPFAAVDIELFERAIANLVDNALKFCRSGDRIALAAQVDDAGRVRIGIGDTGPGIAPDDLAHLFDRFYQSRHNVAPATGEGGKGLGLAIVKRIAELHGGTVSVTSRQGAGTTVVMLLPSVGG